MGQTADLISDLQAENAALRSQLAAKDDHPALAELIAACGWQGGTVWQVVTEIGRLKQANAKLLACIRSLLTSADCEWERCNLGHDWAEECKYARELLSK